MGQGEGESTEAKPGTKRDKDKGSTYSTGANHHPKSENQAKVSEKISNEES